MSKTYQMISKKFNQGCTDYGLLADDDRILIALSGGKDSLMLTQLMAQRARIYKPAIKIAAAHVIMDNIPYETDRTYLESFCKSLGVELHIIHSSFDESTDKRKTKCFLCAWNRRKVLFQFAQENNFNKVALGHHQDDIIVTWLMNAAFEGNTSTMMPLMKMKHYPLQIIRPMCLVHEEWITEAATQLNFNKQKVPCPYEEASRRKDITDIFRRLENINEETRHCLWRCATNSSHSKHVTYDA